jgi:NAD(P)H-dependent FMN reductase
MTNPESATKKVAIIIGSTRARRIGPSVASFVKDILTPAAPDISFSLLDIATFNLPVFDEPDIPATVPHQGGKHVHAHTIAWSNTIKSFDGYIIVSPEYNLGIPGGLKNAIDYLFNEWVGKPVMVVTYGLYGGKTCSEALKTTFGAIYVDLVETRPQLTFPGKAEVIYMTPAAMSAAVGELNPVCIEAWSGEGKEEILKGLGELKGKLFKS